MLPTQQTGAIILALYRPKILRTWRMARACIKGAARELFGGKLLRCQANEICFCMPRGISPGHNGIFCFQDNPVVFVHEHGSKGMIAVLTGAPRHGNGCFQVSKFCVIHGIASCLQAIIVKSGALKNFAAYCIAWQPGEKEQK
jgi:hypothetical protein